MLASRIPGPITLQKAARQSPQQTLRAYSFNVDTAAGATTSLEAACSAHNGRAPDAVFLVAGGASPGFFIEQSEETLKQQFDQNYWAQAWSAWVSIAARMLMTEADVAPGCGEEDGSRKS